ncbi:hypothetical protein [Flavobacterium ajazii]|uniref:hypothetical protein n=1 Tax=Flavobacterium ajazii TaxID=2692318 RepID=UPI0013D850C7|nr:hypothetical protein [Flavobacterium ajazii]
MDRVKVKISEFTPIKNYWSLDSYRKSKYPNRCIFSRRVGNKKSGVKNPFQITFLLYYDFVKDKCTIGFNGSIRKWYFGKNTRQNLSSSKLIDCIKLLSLEIGIREEDLLNAKVTQLESGVTLLLKSAFKELMNCFVKYRNFRREVENTTVYFKGKKNKEDKENNIKYKFYEKYLEINKNDKNFKTNSIKKNVHRKFFFFRFEIVVKKVSGVSFYHENARTLKHIIKNWKKINNELKKRLQAIQFVDLISEEKLIDHTKLSKIDHEKYLKFQKIKRNGFHRELEKFEFSNTTTNRSTKTKAFIKNYEMFLDKHVDYKTELFVAFDKKINSLL